MSSAPPSLPPRRPRPVFRPRFVLSLIYLAVAFFCFSLLLIAPELLEVMNSVPPGPEQEQAAARVAQEAVRPRLPIAFALSLFSIGVGGYFGLLPGLRSD